MNEFIIILICEINSHETEQDFVNIIKHYHLQGISILYFIGNLETQRIPIVPGTDSMKMTYKQKSVNQQPIPMLRSENQNIINFNDYISFTLIHFDFLGIIKSNDYITAQNGFYSLRDFFFQLTSEINGIHVPIKGYNEVCSRLFLRQCSFNAFIQQQQVLQQQTSTELFCKQHFHENIFTSYFSFDNFVENSFENAYVIGDNNYLLQEQNLFTSLIENEIEKEIQRKLKNVELQQESPKNLVMIQLNDENENVLTKKIKQVIIHYLHEGFTQFLFISTVTRLQELQQESILFNELMSHYLQYSNDLPLFRIHWYYYKITQNTEIHLKMFFAWNYHWIAIITLHDFIYSRKTFDTVTEYLDFLPNHCVVTIIPKKQFYSMTTRKKYEFIKRQDCKQSEYIQLIRADFIYMVLININLPNLQVVFTERLYKPIQFTDGTQPLIFSTNLKEEESLVLYNSTNMNLLLMQLNSIVFEMSEINERILEESILHCNTFMNETNEIKTDETKTNETNTNEIDTNEANEDKRITLIYDDEMNKKHLNFIQNESNVFVV